MTRAEVLAEAARIVSADRTAIPGEPEDSFGLIAALWSALLGREVAPHQVALMLAGLKMARAWQNPGHVDSFIDLAGYAACAADVAPASRQADTPQDTP